MPTPQLPPLPQQLPRTQAEWDRAVTVLQDWARIVQPLLQLIGDPATSASAGAHGDVPAQVVGYLVATINGTQVKVPYYGT